MRISKLFAGATSSTMPSRPRSPVASPPRDSPPSPTFNPPGGHVAGQGSAGNVIAALCSFFVPGLGQLLQGRLLMAVVHFVLAGLLWIFLLGWIIHLWSILDAAIWKPSS